VATRVYPNPETAGALADFVVELRGFEPMAIAGVADVGHVVRFVGRHEAGLFARQHQPLVARGIARVGLQKVVAAQNPEVSTPRDGLVSRNWSRIEFTNDVVERRSRDCPCGG
jgi:hypothetical protein